MRKEAGRFVCALIAAAAMAGCGGKSPTAPSDGGVRLQGVVLQASPGGPGASAGSAGVSAQSAAGSRITVTLQENPKVTTTVAINGTFELEGLPPGQFSLVFSSNGVTLGTITISVAQGTTEVKIVVQVTTTTVVLVNLEFDNDKENENEHGQQGGQPGSSSCMISGGRVGQRIELEGTVDSGSAGAFMLRINGNRAGGGLVNVLASGATFKCNGGDKKSASTCQSTLKHGAKVHVKGVLSSCGGSAASVNATEVKIQKSEGEEADDE